MIRYENIISYHISIWYALSFASKKSGLLRERLKLVPQVKGVCISPNLICLDEMIPLNVSKRCSKIAKVWRFNTFYSIYLNVAGSNQTWWENTGEKEPFRSLHLITEIRDAPPSRRSSRVGLGSRMFSFRDLICHTCINWLFSKMRPAVSLR